MNIKMRKNLKMNLQMFATRNRVEDLFNTRVVLDYFKDLERNYTLGDTLFPEMKIDDIELDIIKGGNNLPVSASVRAWGAEAEIGDRDGFTAFKQELAPISRKIMLNEKEIIKLQNPRTTNELNNTLQKLFNDAESMVDAVRTRAEALRFEALATGKIVINENGYVGELDYGVPADHKETVDVSWLSPDANPLQDLKKWQSKIQSDTGIKPMRALTSERVAGALEDHPSVKRAINGNSEQVVTREDLNNFLSRKGLPAIAVEDRQYRVRKGAGYETHRFFPEDTLSLFPEGALGNMVYGVTAEELELQADGSVDMNTVGNVITTVYRTPDPVARWTKASATAFPSFPVADQVFIATGLLADVPEEEPEGEDSGE